VAFLCRLDLATGELRYAGVGNISARVFGGNDPLRLSSKDGVVGYMISTPREGVHRLISRDVLTLSSDGVRDHFDAFEHPDLLRGEAFISTTGYSQAEVLGQNPRVLKSGKTPPEVFTDLWSTITSGRTWRGLLINRKKNGEFFWESAAIAPIINLQHEITHFAAVKEDITERKQAQDALHDALDVISGSIRYASRIQRAVLPPSEDFARIFSNLLHHLEPARRGGRRHLLERALGRRKPLRAGRLHGPRRARRVHDAHLHRGARAHGSGARPAGTAHAPRPPDRAVKPQPAHGGRRFRRRHGAWHMLRGAGRGKDALRGGAVPPLC
jgi:PAS domain S-box-containing protein